MNSYPIQNEPYCNTLCEAQKGQNWLILGLLNYALTADFKTDIAVSLVIWQLQYQFGQTKTLNLNLGVGLGPNRTKPL